MTVAVNLPQRTAAPRGLWRFGRPTGLALLILLLGFLTLYPMAMLFYGSLHSTPPGIEGTFNLDGYAGLVSAENLAVIANTAGLSLIKTVLTLPVTTSAFILSFIRGMESFESAVFFGTPVGINVITTQIYNLITQRAQPDYQSATALGFAAMALMFLLLLLQGRLLGGKSFTTVTGKGYQPNVTRLGPLRWLTFTICLGFFALTVALPVGQLFISSFFQ